LKHEHGSKFGVTTALALLAGSLVLIIGGGARFAIGLTSKPIVEHIDWNRSDLGLVVAAFRLSPR
jgi:hypothetical protein